MARAEILHVEDDPDDAFFVGKAFNKALGESVVRHVKDGHDAIEYLKKTGVLNAAGSPEADLVLLDLKLPDVDGFEVLQWIRSQPRFKQLVVIILSGSSVEADKVRAHQLGANAYFSKTIDYRDVVAFVASQLANRKSGPGANAGSI